MGWCDDPKDKNRYNKLIKIKKNIQHEKLFRKDDIYDFIIPILYNSKKNNSWKRKCYILASYKKLQKKTLGCIALKKKIF